MFDAWILRHADDVQAALFLTLFVAMAIAEALAPARAAAPERRSRWWPNLLLTAINIGVQSLLPVSFLAAALWAYDNDWGLLQATSMPVVGVVAVTLLGRAFVSFSTHYLMHKVPWLWRLHRVHHLDTEMDVSTTVRFHPLEFAAALPIGLPVVLALGLSPTVLIVYEILDAGINVVSHSNLRLPLAVERWLHYLLVTPDLHRVHHSAHQPETDSNFGAVFPVWDLVFRTFRATTRDPHETMELGLAEVRDERTRNPLWLLASPFLDWQRQSAATREGKTAEVRR